MAVVQVKQKLVTAEQGNELITLRIDMAAGADTSTAFVFDRPFAAKPVVMAIVRDDDTALDVALSMSIGSLTTLGGNLRQKGTSTVIQTFNVTFAGNYINATAYLRS
jgi:hypothetical protein